MKRKAVLIEGSNVVEEKKLPGAIADIVNWKHFLYSFQGGAWYESEIIHLKNCSPQNIIDEIRKDDVDYLMIVFSGHGFHDTKDCSDYICLNPDNQSKCHLSTDIIENEMRKRSTYGTLIIDACRTELFNIKGKWGNISERNITDVTDFSTACYSMQRDFSHKNFPSNIYRHKPSIQAITISEHPYWLNRYDERRKMDVGSKILKTSKYRNAWQKSFECFNSGFVIMKSCAKAKGADEYIFEQDGRLGGIFTTSLLDATYLWEKEQNTPLEIYSTLNTFTDALKCMRCELQKPEYSPKEYENPFALS